MSDGDVTVEVLVSLDDTTVDIQGDDLVVSTDDASTVVELSTVGPTGPAGTAGTAGAPGVGVPTGGTSGQFLTKNSNADYDTVWQTGSGSVTSVFGRTGVVIAVAGDYTAAQVTNVPAGGIAAITVQAAINELDTEKANIASPTFTGDPKSVTPAAGDADTSIATTQFVDRDFTKAPAANTADFVPQWNGANSKTLKDGLGVGTGANQLVQLDGSSRLPAVDGSQLTNLAGGTPTPPQGRLTLQTLTPVMSTTQSAKTILYYTPYVGQNAPMYNGTTFVMKDLRGELLCSTTDTAKNPAAIGASKVNDWFLWEDTNTVTVTIASPGVFSWTSHGMIAGQPLRLTTSGALPTGLSAGVTYYVISAGLTANAFEVSTSVGGAAVNTSGSQSGTHTATVERVTHGPDWTSDTARSAGTALVMVNGILLNNASITNGPAASRGTYVGTTRSNGSSQLDWIYGAVAANGTAGFFGVWNAYNRRPVSSFVGDNTNAWTYVTAAWRAANASATMRHSFVIGLVEDGFTSTYNAVASSDTVTRALVGVGLNSTTAFTGATSFNATAAALALLAACNAYPALGFNFISAIEQSDSGTATYQGDNGQTTIATGLSINVAM